MTVESQQNPLRIAYYLINYPCRVICVVLLLLLCITVVDFFGFEFTTSTTHAYLVMDDKDVHRKDALDLAVKYLGESSSSVQPKTTEINDYNLLLMHKTRDSSNILQPSSVNDYIKYINDTNNKIPYTDYTDYYSLCLADTTDAYTTYPDCSSSSIYDPIVSYFGHMQTITQNDIDTFIDSNLNNPYIKSAFLSCFEEGFESTRQSQYYRSFYRFGLPYPDIDAITSSFKDATDERKEQDIYYSDYIFPIYQDIQVHSNDHENIEVVILGQKIRDLQRQELTNDGILFAAGSILTVFLIMCWHLNSLFLAFSAMTQILAGFPFAYFFYRFAFMVTYFDTMSTLVIFLILGIGADDVFVFVDAWVQSPTFVSNPEDLVERMSFAYRRAAKAMIVTTATTFFAFMATAFSPIMPIAGFGIWAGCVVVVNYCMVITLCPALLSFWYQYVRKYEKWPNCCIKLKKIMCFCSNFRKNKNNELQDNDTSNNNKTPSDGNNNLNATNSHLQVTDTPISVNSSPSTSSQPRLSFQAAIDGTVPNNEQKVDARRMEKILGGTFANIIIKLRWFILIFAILLVSASTYKAISISPLTQQEQWFDESHYMEKMFSWQKYFNGGSVTTLIKIKLVWGIEETVDRTGVTFWDHEMDNIGKPIFDNEFNPSTYDSQIYLLNICNSLLTNYSYMLYDINDYFDCWVYDFITYGTHVLDTKYPFIFDMNNKDIQREKYNELIYNWSTKTAQGAKYVSQGKIGYMDNTFKFMIGIEFTIPHSQWITLNEKKEIYDEWEIIFTEFNDNAPHGFNKAFQTTGFSWAWMASEKGFVISAVQGMAIAMPLALLCLVLSTQNWILSIYATSAIIGIICCEVALMVLQGWELGISECIAIVMMIGFSVDYVVHLANAYQECQESDKRNDKIRFALFTMGISVVSGAMTTFGSGFFLIFPEMLFFKKFGILVMTVVMFSLFFSMVYFIGLLSLFGPQGKTGTIPIGKIFKPLSKCYCKCCKYICCCIGTMDNYYGNKDENKKNVVKVKETELVVPSNVDQVMSASELSDDDSDHEVP
eukprot:274819_1